LFAPKPGEESRKELKEAIDEIKEKYSPEIIRAKEQAMDAIKTSKEKIEDAYKNFNDYLKAKQMAKAKNNETNVEEM
jgi:gas vesicle protein